MSPRSLSRTFVFGAALLATLSGWRVDPALALVSVTVSGSQAGGIIQPGAAKGHVFLVQITNSDPVFGATLTSISFTNITSASGSTQAQRDQDWQTLELWDPNRLQVTEPLQTSAQIPEDDSGL